MADPDEPARFEETTPPSSGPAAGIGSEQRAHVRFYYYARRPAAPYGLGGGLCEGEARLHDISRGGFALLAPRGLNPGTAPLVRLRTTDPELILTQLAEVTRVRRLGPLHWHIGCEFPSPLSDEDLERVVGKTGPNSRVTRA